MSSKKISVLLPTYHREDQLQFSIKSVLNQDFTDFELLILDDYGKDNTEKIVKSFKDNRIIYIKNKKNIGYGNNLKKGFRLAKGTYVFLLGDDDVILKNDTLRIMYDQMEKKLAGYAQVGYIFCDSDFYHPTSLNHVTQKLLYIPPTKDIILKTLNWHFGSISGSFFRKDLFNEEDIIDDVWWPYYKAIYRAIQSRGCIYFGNHYIVARISTSGLIKWLDSKVNKEFYMNKLFEIYKEFDDSISRFQTFQKNRLDFVLSTFPGIKFYTSNGNIISMAKDILRHRPQYKYEIIFWKNIVIALLIPNIILSMIRTLRLLIAKNQMTSFTHSINLKKHLDEVLKEPTLK